MGMKLIVTDSKPEASPGALAIKLAEAYNAKAAHELDARTFAEQARAEGRKILDLKFALQQLKDREREDRKRSSFPRRRESSLSTGRSQDILPRILTSLDQPCYPISGKRRRTRCRECLRQRIQAEHRSRRRAVQKATSTRKVMR